MPIYEFICQKCHRRMSSLVRDISAPFAPKCSSCGSTHLSHAVSGFAYHKLLKAVWKESGEPTIHTGEDYYKDPRNIGRWMEKKFQDLGQELPSQIQEKIQAAREGVLPEPLKDLKSASPTAAYD
ncbi:MAG: zinc ribbon domain-containing protein [Dehalococcoidia bacterium]|nr:MAG: zinc ribbon domain-containing protein [Dehalococcoidia bacterium]